MSRYTLRGTLNWEPAADLPGEAAAKIIVRDAVGIPDTRDIQILSIGFPGEPAEVTAAGEGVPTYIRAGWPIIEFVATWRGNLIDG